MPLALADLLAIGLQYRRILCVAVVVNILLVTDTFGVRPCADAVGALWAGLQHLYLETAVGNLWLAELLLEQAVRYGAVGLAQANGQRVVV